LKRLNSQEQVYEITTTWDNDTLPQSDKIIVKLSAGVEAPSSEIQLILSVEARFYDDPHIPDTTPNETMWELWEYEVVELFLLGSDDHYLEIEVSPKGQYLLLELKGYRNVIRDKLPLYKRNYVARINSTVTPNRWTGRAVIPNCYLPPTVTKFNAYAIHGSDENRIYKSLFPAKKGELQGPDFHNLTYFGPIDLEGTPNSSQSMNGYNNSFAVTIALLFAAKRFFQ
jgi:hypothetical protein